MLSIGITSEDSQQPVEQANDYVSSSASFIESHYIAIVSCIVIFGVGFHLRHKIGELLDRYRTRRRISQGYYQNLGTFEGDINDGLSSSNFDLEANNSNDSRKGLSEAAKEEVKKIMNTKGISFDEARLEYTRSELNKNNIDENGLPKDPKLVVF
ncbi:hypothetical protein FOB58_001952 [Candida parapsilosis]|uniref:Uncharacterized protein n=2 Tax=Candida parapsilosis TaxID=5480 RepID=G8BAC1_CANPC|nr:uncharacterized protein CPAR2_805430 [Candida parapsilosis]KAF6051892.1 hypothetical protein FOB58_001952 [Candida parapsilosis]KAF6052611.1 hypothetical protein FOB60_002867 [Candida parapsilosis]KAF6053694.1 hypothetical protein FOB59_001976 [Candida parapsilosis]KAF6064387.1 hypothetical protein FOB61_002813 [Candida parapsilosis]KAI5905815.1 uncharacterized protein K4G60_g5086 [Candida parapsilosis]